MDLQQNERLDEWFLIVGDWIRETPKIWFYAAAAVVILAIPTYMFVNLIFEQMLINSQAILKVNYQEVAKQPLEVIDKKIFSLGNDTYSGYIRLKNSNTEWGSPDQRYFVNFKSATGASVMSTPGATFVLPSSEKVVVFPRFSSDSPPTQIDFTLNESAFIRAPSLPTLNLVIERRSLDTQVNETRVNAVIVNDTPFKISRVDLPVLLFDSNNQVIGANYTNINDLSSSESRSFQYIWYNRINNVARIEIIPELNIFNRDIFVAAPGQNPFDDRE